MAKSETLNDIPFLRFGAFGAQDPVAERPDRILVWPVQEEEWKELWLRDDGVSMDGSLPAELEFITVEPGMGFRFETRSPYPTDDVDENSKPYGRKYMVVRRPYD